MVNYNDNLYERRGVDGRSHIPALPLWFSVIRILQLLFAFLILIFTAYAGSMFDSIFGTAFSESFFPGYSMSYFAFPWTLLFLLYIFLAPFYFPKLYHYWIHLGLEILTTIFWLTTFALLANELPAWSDNANADSTGSDNTGADSTGSGNTGAISYLGFSYKKVRGLTQAEQDSGFQSASALGNWNSVSGTSRAAVAFSCLEWLSFMVTLGLFSFFLHRHRTGNGATGFGGFGTRSGATHDIEKPQHGVELRNVQQE